MIGEITGEAQADQTRLASKPHFAVMDGLRGVAALVVVLFHSFLSEGIAANGRLAVDLFFILSGFVIAYSYDDKLSASMPKREFFLRRFIRLYPMLFIGALGGLLMALVRNHTNPAEAYPLGSTLSSGGLSLLVLPYFSDAIPLQGTPSPPIFSFNPPIWSLFFEILANIVYVLAVRRLSIPVLAAIIVAGVVGVVWCGPLGGNVQADFWTGFPRVACGFFGGVLLFKLRRFDNCPRFNVPPLLLVAITLILLCSPPEVMGLMFLPVYPILCLIVLSASMARPSRLDRLYGFLGLISYPVYLVHWQTLFVFNYIFSKFHGLEDAYVVARLVHLAAIPFIGFAFAHFYETPVRLFLTRHLLGVKPSSHNSGHPDRRAFAR